MLRSRRGRGQAKQNAAAGAVIEPLEVRSLLSVAAVPLTPGVAAGPVGALTTLTPTFTWSGVTGVNGYQLRVLDRTDGVYALTVNVGPTVTEYTAKAGTLLPGRSFSWTVLDLIGTTPAAAHGHLYFGTPVPPAPVAITAGEGGSDSRPVLDTATPTLTWTAVPDVSGYVVDVYDESTRMTVTHTVPAMDTSYTFAAGALQPGHRFDWNVRDLVGTTTSRAVSNTAHFQLATVAAPTALTGGDSRPVLATGTPTLAWSAVANVSAYTLDVYDESTHATVTENAGATATSYTFAAGVLQPGHRFDWTVRGVTGTTTSPAVSNTAHFQLSTLPAVVTIGPGTAGGPGPVLTTFTPTFSWEAVTSVGGFGSYLLTLDDRSAGTSTTVTVGAPATSYTLPSGELVAGHRYVWSVRLTDGSFDGPAVSVSYRFFVAPAVS